jgi:predicted NBD/HSP70 family sugar kinase
MYLLFDIGGSHMRFATSNGKQLDHVRMLPTPKSYEAALEVFRKSAAGIQGKIEGVIGGVPRFAGARLDFWHTNPAAKDISRITKSKITLANDAELGALGEAVFGAGKGHKIVAYLTFSTGFGGAKVVNGQVDANHMGFEPKMQIAAFDPKKKTSPSLMNFVSGRGIKNRLGKPAEKIRNKKTWAEIEMWMRVAVHNAAVFWSPECIVMGGAIAANKNVSLKRMNDFVADRFENMPAVPIVKKAALGQLSGLYGALALAKKK